MRDTGKQRSQHNSDAYADNGRQSHHAEKRKLASITPANAVTVQKENAAFNPPSPKRSPDRGSAQPPRKRRVYPLSPQPAGVAHHFNGHKKGLNAFRFLVKPQYRNPVNYYQVLDQHLHVLPNAFGAVRPILSFDSRNPRIEKPYHFLKSRVIQGLIQVGSDYHALKKINLRSLQESGLDKLSEMVSDIKQYLSRNIKSEVRPKFVLAVVVDDATQFEHNKRQLGAIIYRDYPNGVDNFRVRFIDKSGQHSNLTTIAECCYVSNSNMNPQPIQRSAPNLVKISASRSERKEDQQPLAPKQPNLISRYLSQNFLSNSQSSASSVEQRQIYREEIKKYNDAFQAINHRYQDAIVTKLTFLKSYLDTPEAKFASPQVIRAVKEHFEALIQTYIEIRDEINQFRVGKLARVRVSQSSLSEEKRLYSTLSDIVSLLEANVSKQVKTYESLRDKINIGTFSHLSREISAYANTCIAQLSQSISENSYRAGRLVSARV